MKKSKNGKEEILDIDAIQQEELPDNILIYGDKEFLPEKELMQLKISHLEISNAGLALNLAQARANEFEVISRMKLTELKNEANIRMNFKKEKDKEHDFLIASIEKRLNINLKNKGINYETGEIIDDSSSL